MPVLDEDLVRVYGQYYDRWTRETKKNRVVKVYYWGDEIDFLDPEEADDSSVRTARVRYYVPGLGKHKVGTIKKKRDESQRRVKQYLPIRLREGDDKYLLEVTSVDVQQGDATLVRTPARKTLLIDGGEGKFIARLLAAEYPDTSEDDPFIIDVLVVTHGDADHFSGLVELAKAHKHRQPRKKIVAKVARYLHNGLVKAPTTIRDGDRKRKRPQKKMFGDFYKDEMTRKTYATSIFDDPRDALEPNEKFQEWHAVMPQLFDPQALAAVDKLPAETLPRIERIGFGQADKFDILRKEGLDFHVLGPILHQTNGDQWGLEFLRDEDGRLSAGHTINGHSVVLKMSFGKVGFMLGGDLNIHAEKRLLEHLDLHEGPDLRSEIFKAPHHGSHEFAPEFLKRVAPVVSIVSSGDENRMKEYVHPRANLMAALGRFSRGPMPLLFSTELAAFFAYRGPVLPERHRKSKGKLILLPKKKWRGKIHAFQRLVFGSVRVRTDGQRVMCAVESASDGVKEAYVFRVSDAGEVTFEDVRML